MPSVNTDPRVDAYIAAAQPFARPILIHLRALVHGACPAVEETIKWGMPFFMLGERNLAHMAAFKAHCAFGFGHGRQVVDLGLGHEAMGQFGRVGALGDLPPRPEMVALVKKAAALVEAGVKPPRAEKNGSTATGRRPLPQPPPDLLAALARNAAARKTFEAFAPGHRRDYIDWISEAKRDATRQRRLAQAVAWMAEGKRQNWRYEAR
ncbi:MAG: YdeI/OmpD-associated family protein [Rubrivivax sp.]|nr:YdeI/OmpD-associated family protein [Rubrivivax sp.]